MSQRLNQALQRIGDLKGCFQFQARRWRPSRELGRTTAEGNVERVPDDELVEQAPDGRCHHRGARFTGLGFSLHPTGELAVEDEYRDGLLWGTRRRCRPDGVLLEEGARVAGHMEGIWRRWHPNGRLASEEFCYFDFTLARMRWDPDGRVVEDFVLAESAPQYRKRPVKRRGLICVRQALGSGRWVG